MSLAVHAIGAAAIASNEAAVRKLTLPPAGRRLTPSPDPVTPPEPR